MRTAFIKTFKTLASLKVALPLLVITTIPTIIGTLLPNAGIYQSWWYLSLLGLLSVCLLCTTIDRVPTILQRKGRQALIGVVVTHLGVLILLAGYLYGESVGFRHEVRVIEKEMMVIPELPFVIQLDELVIEAYSPGTFEHLDLERLPNKVQDSRISLYKNGKLWRQGVARPGNPMVVDGITLVPSLNKVGWFFDYYIKSKNGRETRVASKPWAPPKVKLGTTEIMVHQLSESKDSRFQVLGLVDNQPESLGIFSRDEPLEVEGYTLLLGDVKRFTGLTIYQRPQMPILLIGCLVTLSGLIWHFYFREKKVMHQD